MIKIEFECASDKVDYILGVLACVIGCQIGNITVSRGMSNYCAIYMGKFNATTLCILHEELSATYKQGLVSYFSIGRI